MTNPVKDALQGTPTAQLRRVTIPPHRRKAQAIQTLCGILFGVVGSIFTKYLGLSWHFTAMVWLVAGRIVSKEFVKDTLKILTELAGLVK